MSMTREEAIKELQSYADASWGSLNEALALGKKYGIDPAYVWRIINGQKRKRIP